MIKRFCLLVMTLAFVHQLTAQIRVAPNGFVSINQSTSFAPLSRLSVGSGQTGYEVGIIGQQRGLYSESSNVYYGWSSGVWGVSIFMGEGFSVGVGGESVYSYMIPGGRAFGVFGRAGNATTGWNYGVYGELAGTRNGAAIYGTTTNGENGVCLDARYAGYFNGNVRINGNLSVAGELNGLLLTPAGSYESSAYNEGGHRESFADRLERLEVSSYYLDSPKSRDEVVSLSDTVPEKEPISPIEQMASERVHYNLSIEQLKEAFPELVYEQPDGKVSVNYVELIPILVQTVNELRKTVDEIKGTDNKARGATGIKTQQADEMYLLQNVPNPSVSATTISYKIPVTVSSAQLYICDLQGQLKKAIELPRKGASSVTVPTADMAAGIYLYSLVVDGEVCATKRMIVKN